MDSKNNPAGVKFPEGTRIPPQALDVERHVIGGMLLSGDAIAACAEKLIADDFYLDRHRILYQTIVDMSQDGREADLVTLTDALQKKGVLEKVGGQVYLSEISAEVLSWANIASYCDILREKSVRRELINASNRILEEAYQPTSEALDLLDQAEASIYRIGEKSVSKDFTPLHDALHTTLRDLDSYKSDLTGVPTGYVDLDGMTGGLQPTDLIVLAARPGMGKTSLALNIAANAAIHHGKTIAVFSLEMGEKQLVTRLLCREARINFFHLRRGDLPRQAYNRLTEAAQKLRDAKIFLDDSSFQTPIQIKSKCRRLANRTDVKLDLVIIDYLQLMQGQVGGRPENRQQEISTISRSLKGMAKDLGVPVLALSQLSRAAEKEGPAERPKLSHLRESGAIEQDADIVMAIFREEEYKRGDPSIKNKAELIILKHRNGPQGTVNLTYLKEFTSFENYTDAAPDEGGF